MSKPTVDKLEKLSKILGYHFSDTGLLQEAITHRSGGKINNERLEFLGDSIINFVIASALYERFPKAKEGELTRMRAGLVKGETLAQLARDLQIGDFLTLGIGEKKSGGFERDSILADAMEAITGAIFLDSSMEICQRHLLVWFQERLEKLVPGDPIQKDPKTQLQELLQAQHLPLPEYQIIQVKGDPHNPIFEVQCFVTLLDNPIVGTGSSRRRAEQEAALQAIKAIKHDAK